MYFYFFDPWDSGSDSGTPGFPSASELSVYGVPPLSVCSCLTNFRRIRSGQTRFLHCVSCAFALRYAFCAGYAQARRIRSSVFGDRVLSYLSVSSGHFFAGYAQIQPDTLRSSRIRSGFSRIRSG